MPEIKYMSKDGSSNKVWSYEVTSDTSVIWRFGRIGGHITEQTEQFQSNSAMQKKISKKVAEKTANVEGKRYTKVDEQQYHKEHLTAQDIGTRNKIEEIMFVDRADEHALIRLPAYDSSKFVLVRVIDSWSKDVRNLLLNKNESYEVSNFLRDSLYFSNIYRCSDLEFVNGLRRHIGRLAEKVREAIKTFAAIGARKLHFDNADDTVISSEPDNELIISLERSEGASAQVIKTFAAMGARKLDL
jgi:predicted DNA-binding WGR domain protein